MNVTAAVKIEFFAETRLRKLCAILRSRVIWGVNVLMKDIGRRDPPKCYSYNARITTGIYIQIRPVFSRLRTGTVFGRGTSE